jgi:hypothetical protein
VIEMTGVVDLLAEVWFHLFVEVVRVRNRTGEHERPAGLPGRRDRKVRRLFCGDPAEPQQRPAAGT